MFEEQIISAFGQWGVLAVVFISAFLPILETRVAIPLGCATAIWGSGAMSVWGATTVAFCASTLAGLLVVVTLSPIMKILRKRKQGKNLVNSIEVFFQTKTAELSKNKKISTKKIMFLMITLIALPLPFMGVYSGAGMGVFLKLKWWQNFIVITVGNAVGCLILALTCWALYPFVPLLLTCLIIILALIICWYIINMLWILYHKKVKNKVKNL